MDDFLVERWQYARSTGHWRGLQALEAAVIDLARAAPLSVAAFHSLLLPAPPATAVSVAKAHATAIVDGAAAGRGGDVGRREGGVVEESHEHGCAFCFGSGVRGRAIAWVCRLSSAEGAAKILPLAFEALHSAISQLHTRR